MLNMKVIIYLKSNLRNSKIAFLFNKKSIELKRAINKWRLNIQISFNIDPLKCPNCDTIMVYTESLW